MNTLSSFDAKMNSFIKGNKSAKGYSGPDEQMMAHWMRQYGGLDESVIQDARNRRNEVKRDTGAGSGQRKAGSSAGMTVRRSAATSGSYAATRPSRFCTSDAWVDPTLQHKNRAEILVDGPEIVVRPVGTHQG